MILNCNNFRILARTLKILSEKNLNFNNVFAKTVNIYLESLEREKIYYKQKILKKLL